MRASKIPLALACVLVVLGVAGCDSFFEVENPTDIEADDLDNQNMTTALANSPHIAVAEWYDFAVEIGGLPGDGVIHASNNQGNLRPDRGTFGTFTQRAENLYNGLASAQWTARETTEKLRGLIDSPDSDARVARGYYWDALARVTLADLYERVTFDGGPPHDPPEVYRIAIDILERAASIGRSAGDMEVVAAAEATIARAYRSMYFDTGGNDGSLFEEAAQHAQAALDAQSDFVFYARYAPPGSENGLFDALANGSTYDLMDPKIAYIEDPASGMEDPRVQHTDQQGVGSRGDTIYWQQKYTGRDDDIPVSSWEEAVLILAEYHLMNDELSSAVDRINDARSDDPPLPEFSSSDANEIRAQLIYERRVEFWLELRRWQDMRYYDIVPERWTAAAKAEGVDRRFPIALRECTANENVSC